LLSWFDAMLFNNPTTELTTAATDVALGFVCVFLMSGLHDFRTRHPWKVRLWSWVFGLLAAASFLGAIAHGFYLSPALRSILWQPLYLALGIDVSLFVLGGISDWRGEKAARKLVAAAIAAGAAFYSLTRVTDGAFLIFIIYEGVAMAAAIAIYTVVAVRQRMPGASIIAVAIGLNIVAAALQASTIHFTAIWPFDHNGVFHLVQIAALLILGYGLRASLSGAGGHAR
jgi:hypothetical protein